MNKTQILVAIFKNPLKILCDVSQYANILKFCESKVPVGAARGAARWTIAGSHFATLRDCKVSTSDFWVRLYALDVSFYFNNVTWANSDLYTKLNP